MLDDTETCKYWRFGFCSRGEKCKFPHPEEEHGMDRDPNLPADVTTGEQKSGNRVARGKRFRGGRESRPSTWSEPPRTMAKVEGESVTIEVKGIPSDASMREITQIFRQYDGFLGCKIFPTGEGKTCAVDVLDRQTGLYIMECLDGYQFDERNPNTFLEMRFASKGSGSKGKGKGASKGKGK